LGCGTPNIRFQPTPARKYLVALLACVSMSGRAAATDDAKLGVYGRHLAQECTSCHRTDGIDIGIPSIVGWPPDVFVATMSFYRDGSRTNPVMVSVANSLAKQQVDALAAYFASLPKPTPKFGPDGSKKVRK
jgi:cytochrome c553